MRTRTLGASDIDISVIGFGSWETSGMWGPGPEGDQVVAAMHASFDNGVNWVDTAEIYGPHHSEELVGRAIKGRDDILVFTKVAPTVEMNGMTIGSGLDAAGVRAGAEGSLRRLGRDVIDLFMVHAAWPFIPVEETWTAMAQLVDDGLVRAVGVSNYEDVALLERCEAIRHVDAVQNQFSLFKRQPLDDVIPWCREHGTTFLAYGPLAFGVLTGAVTEETEFAPDDWRTGAFPMPTSQYDDIFAGDKLRIHAGRAAALRPVADRLNLTLAQLALAWTTHQGPVAAIAGTRSIAHATENAKAGAVHLEAKDLEEIGRIVSIVG